MNPARNTAFAQIGLPIVLPLWLMCGVYWLASANPGGRLWAFDIFAYFDADLPNLLLILTAVLGLTIYLLTRRWSGTDLAADAINLRGYYFIVLALSIAMAVCFYLFRAQTFFLGDGYTLLNLLATGNPLIEKGRQWVESMVHVWLYEAIDGGSEQDAVIVYQMVSIAAGILYLIVLSFASRRLFERGIERILFFLGLTSGGWMLLYFGHVENYSMYVLLIMIYCLLGILVFTKNLEIWYVAGLQIILFAFHIFSVTLIPATLYLVLRDSKIARWFTHRSTPIKAVTIAVCASIPIAGYFYAWTNDLFFRVALVPLSEYMLVPEGYTLFSVNHIIDFVNLVFLLIPGLLILVSVFACRTQRVLFRQPLYRWLGLAVLGSLGAAFIFDPKLGMPRDWDLFSFSGVPLSVMLFYGILVNSAKTKTALIGVMLSVLLGFVVLGVRVASVVTPEVGIAHFRDYLYLDKVKNRNGWIFLVNYYANHGNSLAAEQTRAEWKSNFPEERLIAEAKQYYYRDHNLRATDSLLDEILKINPAYPDAYGFKGMIYLQSARSDSALLMFQLADALSPNRPNVLNNLAHAHYNLGNLAEAEKLFLKAARLDSTGFSAQYNLARFYLNEQDLGKYYQYLVRAAHHPEALASIVEELIVVYLRQGNRTEARRVYCSSSAAQQDTTFLPRLRTSLPGIDSILSCR